MSKCLTIANLTGWVATTRALTVSLVDSHRLEVHEKI